MVQDRRFQRPEDAIPTPFTGQAGEDELLANAKRRPVLIVSSRREVQSGGARSGVRIIPIHRRGDKPYYNANWVDIAADRKAGLVVMPGGRPTFPFDEGVLDLRETQLVPKARLPATAMFSLDRGSLETILRAMASLESMALA
jgi:hypothetical protein